MKEQKKVHSVIIVSRRTLLWTDSVGELSKSNFDFVGGSSRPCNHSHSCDWTRCQRHVEKFCTLRSSFISHCGSDHFRIFRAKDFFINDKFDINFLRAESTIE
jgi:hypothetical protein